MLASHTWEGQREHIHYYLHLTDIVTYAAVDAIALAICAAAATLV